MQIDNKTNRDTPSEPSLYAFSLLQNDDYDNFLVLRINEKLLYDQET